MKNFRLYRPTPEGKIGAGKILEILQTVAYIVLLVTFGVLLASLLFKLLS